MAGLGHKIFRLVNQIAVKGYKSAKLYVLIEIALLIRIDATDIPTSQSSKACRSERK